MHILIIGGTGFIGPQIVRRLIHEGHNVTVFHRGQTEPDLLAGVDHIYGERHDLPSFLAEFKRLAPQLVLDMICYTEQDALDLMRVFKGVAERVVVSSSMDVYRAYGWLLGIETGPPDPTPLSEDSPLREVFYPYRTHPKAPRDLAQNYEKILVERVVLSDPQLPGTVLRLPAVYGPGDHKHRLFEYLKRMDDGRPAILLKEELARWRWTRGYVENVAAAIALSVTDGRAAGQIYNVGEKEALTEADWVLSIGRVAGWEGEVIAVPEDLLPEHLKENYDRRHHLAADTTRIRKELGYDEHVSLSEALKQTIAWERAHSPEEFNPAQFDYAAEDAALARLRP